LSVIDGVFAARNHLYRWIYSHHKVLYAEDLLKRAVASLGGIAKEEQDEFLCSLFSLAPFSTLQKVADREFFLPSDGDLIYHLKIVAASDSESYAYEWLSRRYKKVALWKSFAEFCRLFAVSAKYSTTDKATCLNKFQSLAENWKKAQKITDCDIRVLDVSPKLITLDSAKIRIQMGKETVPYTDLLLHTGQDNTSVPEFFYAYIDQHYENRAEELLKYVKSNW
jgi:HD superfamily phosphohydrolase